MSTITPGQVNIQLERMLTSPEFKESKKLGQFLRYVVDETLDGRSESIKQYTVGVEALGYDTDFDPLTNPTVRILAGRLRRTVDQYYYTHGTKDPIRIDIPKGSYIPTFLENQKASELSGFSESPTPVPAQTERDFPEQPTIAVVMFDVLNTDNGFDYIATGLTEEIIISLTRFPNFLVKGPLSRSIIGEQGLDAPSLGQQYGVRFILDGTLRMNGQKFRLTVRLADALNGQQVWGEVLDCGLPNNISLEFDNNLVGKVAASVAGYYGVISRTMIKESLAQQYYNPTTNEAFLYFYHYIRVLTQESYVKAMDSLETAVRKDPDNALAVAMLGDLLVCTYLFGVTDDQSIVERAEALGRKALALNLSSQHGHFTMAMVHFLRFQQTLFLEELEQTLQLNSNNAVFTAALSMHVGMMGEWDRALKMMDKAIYLNPHHPGWYHIVPYMNYYRQGEYDLALIEARNFNTKDFFWDPLIRAAVLGQLDQRQEAGKAIDELVTLLPDFIQRGESLIRRLAYLDEHVDMLLEGLQKAGLELG